MSTPGRPLDARARLLMQAHLGHDFSRVRIHTDQPAADSAAAVNAHAYTVGSHIVFNAGRYQPDSPSGRSLLAHELTHVVQHAPFRASGPIELAPAHDPSEAEAEAAARAPAINAMPAARAAAGAGARQLHRRVIDDDAHVTCRATRPRAFEQIQAAEQEAIRILQLGAEVARGRARVEPLTEFVQGESTARRAFRDALWRRLHVDYENRTVREAWLRLISRRFDWLASAIARMTIVYRCGPPGIEPAGNCTDSPGSGIAWSQLAGSDMQLCDAFWTFDQKRAVLHEWFHIGFGRVDCGFAPEFNTVCWDTFAREIAGEATPTEQVDCCPPPNRPLPAYLAGRP